MESETINRNKKKKADTGNEDFFENENEFSTKEQRTNSLEQSEKDFERRPNECSGKSRIVIIRSKNDRKIFSNPKQCLRLLKNSVFGNVVFKDVEVRGNERSVKFEVRDDEVTGLKLAQLMCWCNCLFWIHIL